MPTVRPAAVAGLFYPDDPVALGQTLDALLAEAGAARLTPKAVIVPHAGYIYSGPIAAAAYGRLGHLRGRIRRVILLGPAHRVFVRGLALPEAQRFATPLGEVRLDHEAAGRIAALPQVTRSDAAHEMEHSLEVQLPFLQRVLGDFTLVPLTVGQASAREVAEVLEALWGGDETLIVISSDLSHFLPAQHARESDRAAADAILALAPRLSHAQACGATPVNGLLLAARRHGLRPLELDLRNSSDTAGDPERVVGYGAFAFVREDSAIGPRGGVGPESEPDKGPILLQRARAEIAARLGRPAALPPGPSWLREPGACFVTLTRQGALRGCVGTLEAYRPLGTDVRENALAAAFRDPRFTPLAREEFEAVRVEVSLLSPTEALVVADEEQALAAMRPGIDGIVFEYRHFRSTFLPQVWEQLPDPADFLARLKSKAGLPADFWSDAVRLSRYTVTKWKEGAVDAHS